MSEDNPPKILGEEHFLESVNDSARHFLNVYAAYLTVMIYIFIIVLSTDQELLFRAGDKPLPLIHISVPIVAFFTWMPWALLVLHFYLLIQVTFLSEKVRLYKQRLKDNSIFKAGDGRKAQMLLASVPLVHILVEKEEERKHAMLYPIVFVSLVVFPLVVLIIAQSTFLPYQDENITQAHRIAVMIDLALLWCFGFYVFKPSGKKWLEWFKSIWERIILLVIILAIMSILPIIIIFGCLYIPNERINIMPMISECSDNYFNLSGYELVKKEPAPELLATHIARDDLIEPGSPTWCQYATPLDLKDRNFRKAQLDGAILCKATLKGADLTSAVLGGANLTSADLRDADLTSAELEGADLTSAYFGGADLTSADLRDADLTSAYFGGADLTSAALWRADLTSAELWGADLTSAELWGADLTSADLRGSILISAELWGADLTSAYLWGADLTSAELWDADLTSAELGGADLTSAELGGANLTSAELWGVDLTSAELGGANLTFANLRNANLTSATLVYSDLTAANLTAADFSDAVLDRTTRDFTWVSADLPIGFPRGWSNTLKPEYSCPWGFDIPDDIVSEYIEYIRREQRNSGLPEQLENRLQQAMEEKRCERYNPQSTR